MIPHKAVGSCSLFCGAIPSLGAIGSEKSLFLWRQCSGTDIPWNPTPAGSCSAAIVVGTDAVFLCSIPASMLLGKMNRMPGISVWIGQVLQSLDLNS